MPSLKFIAPIFQVIFQKRVRVFHRGFKHEKTDESTCLMYMVLSPKCCAVTIFEYSTIEVTLPSCLSVPSEHVASQSKWQSADLDLLKLAKKKKVCGQRYSEETCTFSLIKFLTSVPF